MVNYFNRFYMKKYLKIGLGCVVGVCFIALLYLLFVTPSVPTIQSGTFEVKEWNSPEFIEANTFAIHEGVVLKEMESDVADLYDCIVEVQDGNKYLVYYVDTTKHEVGEKLEEVQAVWIASYNYEESLDMVRRIPVYLSFPGVELLQGK